MSIVGSTAGLDNWDEWKADAAFATHITAASLPTQWADLFKVIAGGVTISDLINEVFTLDDVGKAIVARADIVQAAYSKYPNWSASVGWYIAVATLNENIAAGWQWDPQPFGTPGK